MTDAEQEHPHEADGDHLHPDHWTQATSKSAFPKARPSEYSEYVADQPASQSEQAGEGVETDMAELPSAAGGQPAGTVNPYEGQRQGRSGSRDGS